MVLGHSYKSVVLFLLLTPQLSVALTCRDNFDSFSSRLAPGRKLGAIERGWRRYNGEPKWKLVDRVLSESRVSQESIKLYAKLSRREQVEVIDRLAVQQTLRSFQAIRTLSLSPAGKAQSVRRSVEVFLEYANHKLFWMESAPLEIHYYAIRSIAVSSIGELAGLFKDSIIQERALPILEKIATEARGDIRADAVRSIGKLSQQHDVSIHREAEKVLRKLGSNESYPHRSTAKNLYLEAEGYRLAGEIIEIIKHSGTDKVAIADLVKKFVDTPKEAQLQKEKSLNRLILELRNENKLETTMMAIAEVHPHTLYKLESWFHSQPQKFSLQARAAWLLHFKAANRHTR